MPIPNIDPTFESTTDHLCSYGCNQTAIFKFLSGKYCCSRAHNSCPSNRKKNSEGLQKSGRDYKADYKSLPDETKNRMAWARGLTQDDPRVAKFAFNSKGKRRITDETILKRVLYREQCNFSLAGIIHNVRGYGLLEKYGMYSKKNPNGVVRDHRVSVNYGYKNNIDPKIISHPANCEFLQHKDNARKTFTNSISLEELLVDIEKWCT